MKNLLSIGTVVTLDGAEKNLMIIGVYVENADDNKVYDYIGIPYPEGYVDAETMFLFMHEDIKDVHYVGYINAEHQAFRAQVAALMQNGIDNSEAGSDK